MTSPRTRRTAWVHYALVVVAPLIMFLLSVSALRAQTVVVVPFSAGGGLDTTVRIIAQTIQQQTGEHVIVENRPGANGMIGARYVANNHSDGRTWLAADGSLMTVNPLLYPKSADFDPVRDLRVVAPIGLHPSILVVNARQNRDITTLAEFVDWARSSDRLYASGGIGSTGHLTMEYFARLAGLRLTHVPYKGAAPAILGLLSGHVAAGFVSLPNALPYIRSTELRPVAISSAERDPRLPDVPTVAESGYPDFIVTTGYFIVLPASANQQARDDAESLVRHALADPATQQRLRQQGITPAANMSHDETTHWLESESERWSSFAVRAKIKPD
jgi:tripartite-type tricarboxylate transporter receptor subunit TctC